MCSSMRIDQHGRTLGRCMVGTTDINRTMVALGYAVAYRHYSSDYISAEDSAKASKRGLWSGTFEMPDQYRQDSEVRPEPGQPVRTGRAPRAQRVSAQPSGGCVIKGN